jgi:hypothetical protein
VLTLPSSLFRPSLGHPSSPVSLRFPTVRPDNLCPFITRSCRSPEAVVSVSPPHHCPSSLRRLMAASFTAAPVWSFRHLQNALPNSCAYAFGLVALNVVDQGMRPTASSLTRCQSRHSLKSLFGQRPSPSVFVLHWRCWSPGDTIGNRLAISCIRDGATSSICCQRTCP